MEEWVGAAPLAAATAGKDMSESNRLAERMRRDWDMRAAEDAMYFIDTRSETWEADAFFEQGAAEARELLEPVLARFDFDPSGKRILEIGCGLGRLFPGFAKQFDEIWGVDVSPAMIDRARRVCPVAEAHFILGTGVDLDGIPDASFDYCFSYLVFHHLPQQTIVWRYLEEIWRVLRSGGVCQLQFRSSESLAAAVARRLPAALGCVAQRIRRHTVPGSLATWAGVTFSRRRVIERLQELGFVEVDVFPGGIDDRSRFFWAVARKR